MRLISSAILALAGGVMAGAGAVGEALASTNGGYSAASESAAYGGIAVAVVGAVAFLIEYIRTWRTTPPNSGVP